MVPRPPGVLLDHPARPAEPVEPLDEAEDRGDRNGDEALLPHDRLDGGALLGGRVGKAQDERQRELPLAQVGEDRLSEVLLGGGVVEEVVLELEGGAEGEAEAPELIEEAIVAEGIEVLVQKVSLLSKEFDDKVEALKSDEAKASEMEHAIRAEIHVRIEENPAFYASLKERLEKIIEDRKAQRIEQAKQLDLLKVLIQDLKNEAGAAEKLGLSETGFAIFGVLARGPEARGDRIAETVSGWGSDDSWKELASLIEEAVEPFTDLVDWVHKADIERQLRQQVKRQLRAAQCPPDRVESATATIVDLLKARQGNR